MDIEFIKTFLVDNWSEIKEIIESLVKCLKAIMGNADGEEVE